MKKNLNLLVTVVSIVLIGYHLTQLWFSSQSAFHQDEFQHIHIAWNILAGKLPFKDFFETHGPLSGALFSLALKSAPEPTASIDSIFFLRKLCLFAVYSNLILMFFCLRHFTQKTHIIFPILAVFIGGLTVQVTGFRIRPDIFVQSFLILALIFWFRRYRFLCGVCLGICMGFNPKFLPLNLTFLLADIIDIRGIPCFRSKKIYSDASTKAPLLSTLGGELLTFAGIALVLAYKGILGLALNTVFLENINISIKRYNDPYWHFILFRSAVELDLVLLLTSFFCLLGLGWLIYRKGERLDSTSILLLFLTFTSFLFLGAPMSHHSVLLIIPVFTLLTNYLAMKTFNHKWGQWCLLTLAILISYVSYNNLPKYNGNRHPDFEGLKTALNETARNEPIFYYWPSRCPAYVFNADHSKYWTNEFRTPKMKAGEYENRLANPEIKWVALGDELFNQLNDDERRLLEKDFMKSSCLWKRR